MNVSGPTGPQIGKALGVTNPNATQAEDLNKISGDLKSGDMNKLQSDVIKLSKDDPELLHKSSSKAGSAGAPHQGGGAQGSDSNDSAIQAIIAMLMQLLQAQQGNGQQQQPGGGQPQGNGQPQPVSGA